MNKLIKKKLSGFTMIELLIVLVIIGVLAVAVIASLNQYRAKSRDAKRREDMLAIKNALVSYYSDNLAYPSTGGSGSWRGMFTRSGFSVGTASGASGYIPGLAPGYISALPVDPKHKPASSNIGYIYASDGKDYKFLAWCTVEGTIDPGDQLFDSVRANNPDSSDNQTWQISTPGAALW